MRVKRLGCKGVEVYPRGEVTRGRPEGMSRRIYRGGVSVVGVNRGGWRGVSSNGTVLY